jgi:hypothetical protein
MFADENFEHYGTKDRVPTAVCTVPVLREHVAAAIDHLWLYGQQY